MATDERTLEALLDESRTFEPTAGELLIVVTNGEPKQALGLASRILHLINCYIDYTQMDDDYDE